ncbi:hypothetical protein [Bosea beijingensis]|uniref:hypothetical protein n=1 Tax=Bosea beijingensis TaxID=3068632 RepID=UPI002740EA55|nr:hypothetical protein [Bosea sp. REN20]
MFGLLDLMTKRVTDQIVEYAAAQSDIARRLWGNWIDPFQACKPVRIGTERHPHGGIPREISHRR